jgi:hypothetical protein
MGEASLPEPLVEEARRRGVRLDAADARNLEAIDTFGWAVVMVSPRPPESFAPFAYTIGLSRHHAPELIMVGIDASPAARMLNDIASITRREPIHVGPLPGIVAGGHVLDLRDVDSRHYDDYIGRLLWFHRHFGAGPLRVLQAIWPDKQGRYPDDPRLTEGERAAFWRRQPLLDRV